MIVYMRSECGNFAVSEVCFKLFRFFGYVVWVVVVVKFYGGYGGGRRRIVIG